MNSRARTMQRLHSYLWKTLPKSPSVGAKCHTRWALQSDGNVGDPEVVPRLRLGGKKGKKKGRGIVTHAEQPSFACSLAKLLMCPETAPHHLSMLKMGTEETSRQQLCQLLRELLRHALVNTALSCQSSALRCRVWVVLCGARIRLRGNLVSPFQDIPWFCDSMKSSFTNTHA